MSSAAMRNATLAVLLAAAPAPAETFHNKDGVVFEGTIRLVVSNAAVCNVLEEKSHRARSTSSLKANQGQPLDLWQVDLAVRNESGREIEYLRASSCECTASTRPARTGAARVREEGRSCPSPVC